MNSLLLGLVFGIWFSMIKDQLDLKPPLINIRIGCIVTLVCAVVDLALPSSGNGWLMFSGGLIIVDVVYWRLKNVRQS